jgi:hypothetical protein
LKWWFNQQTGGFRGLKWWVNRQTGGFRGLKWWVNQQTGGFRVEIGCFFFLWGFEARNLGISSAR